MRDAPIKIRGTSMLGIVVIWLLAVATPAQAYLDPSTGSMIISALVGLLATLGLALKTYWYRVRALFRRGNRLSRNEPPSAAATDGDARAPR